MKKLLVIFYGAFCMLHGNTQSMREWKKVICKEEKFSGEDSLIFSHVFDSLNSVYRVVKIFASKRAETNHYVPLWIGRKGVLVLKEDYHLSYYSLWLKEMAHAFQFSRRPIKYNALFLKESTRTLYRTLFQNKRFRTYADTRMSFSEMYKMAYADKRSFEYEAHRVIEVQLNMYMKYRFHQGLPQK